ncbi:unnamed protein product [Allacma fusca]|uniref:Uncharacterized protein n=1 Tax=Allacma fusca TaxID=39272 RepID=A0A8J2JTD8_9HEXA|nr:unnamed protein product [Allacma fusca]
MEGSDDLDFLIGDESLAEEHRSNQIKQALPELDATFQNEDEIDIHLSWMKTGALRHLLQSMEGSMMMTT